MSAVLYLNPAPVSFNILISILPFLLKVNIDSTFYITVTCHTFNKQGQQAHHANQSVQFTNEDVTRTHIGSYVSEFYLIGKRATLSAQQSHVTF